MILKTTFSKLSATAALFAISAALVGASPAQAEQSEPRPAYKLPKVSCLIGARFLTSAGSELSDLVEIKIDLKRVDADRAVATQAADLGNGISLLLKTTFMPKGSIEHKGEDMIIVNSKIARREANGKFTVLAGNVTTSDTDYRDHLFIVTASNFQNPEVETVLLNSGVTSRSELVRKNLIAANTFDSALLTCNSPDLKK